MTVKSRAQIISYELAALIPITFRTYMNSEGNKRLHVRIWRARPSNFEFHWHRDFV